MNDLSIEDREGLLHTSSQRFANAQFGDLDDKWNECSPLEDRLLTAGSFLGCVGFVRAVIWAFWG